MSRHRAILLSVPAALLFGCAFTPDRAVEAYSHTPPARGEVANRKVVDLDFETAWNRLVRNVSVTQFAITNVDKESRILTLDYEGEEGDPQRYVDCGESVRRITYDGETREFRYRTADSNSMQMLYGDARGYHYWAHQDRHLSLAAKVNVYIAPLGARQTEVSVNASMRLYGRFDREVYSYRNNGKYLFLQNQSDPPKLLVTVLTTKPGSFGDPEILCTSTGALEAEVLAQVD